MADAIEKLPFISQSICLDQIESTNTFAKELLQHGKCADSGIAVIRADRQLAGRGRQNRSFFSSVDGGLWVSLIIKIDDITRHFSVNRALSIALCNAISAFVPGSALAIKWPNDIYWADKKICGMLLETAAGFQQHLIAGFGLNVNIARETFPASLHGIASSLLIETGTRYDLEALLEHILIAFESNLHMPPDKIHSRYTALLHKTGNRIRVGGKEGIFDSVDIDGYLILKTSSTTERIVSGTIELID